MIKRCEHCAELEAALSLAIEERNRERKRADETTDLLMKGEALREKIMLGSILTTDEKKAKAVYLLTGKRL